MSEVLVLTSVNRNFPLRTEKELAGVNITRLEEFDDFVATPLRAGPFLLLFEIGAPDDIERALLAYEWAEQIQPRGTGRYLALALRAVPVESRAARFRGVEIAYLPITGKNLRFKVDMHRRLLETPAKETAATERERRGFWGDLTAAPGRPERVMVLKGPGPQRGSWQRDPGAARGGVRWRWVDANPVLNAGASDLRLRWEAESVSPPDYQPAEGGWRLDGENPEVRCWSGDQEVYSARKALARGGVLGEGAARALVPEPERAVKGPAEQAVRAEEDPRAREATTIEPPRKKGPAEKQVVAAIEDRADESEPSAPAAADGKRTRVPLAEALARIKRLSETPKTEPAMPPKDEVGEVISSTARSTEVVDTTREDRVDQERKAREEERALSRDLRGQPAGARVFSPEETAKTAEETAPTIPAKPAHSTDPRAVPTAEAAESRPEEEGTVDAGPARAKPTTTTVPAKAAGGDAGPTARVVPAVVSPKTKSGAEKASSTETATSAPKSPVAKASEGSVPSAAATMKEAPSSSEESAATKSPTTGEAAAEAARVVVLKADEATNEARSKLGVDRSADEGLSSARGGHGPAEGKIRVEADEAAAARELRLGANQLDDGEMRFRAEKARGGERPVARAAAPDARAEAPAYRRQSFVMTLAELGDQNSAWQPAGGYRIYLSSAHRYGARPAPESLLPLWIYEGELAPEFLEGERAWRFYDRAPRRAENLAELPPSLLAELKNGTAPFAAPAAATPSRSNPVATGPTAGSGEVRAPLGSVAGVPVSPADRPGFLAVLARLWRQITGGR